MHANNCHVIVCVDSAAYEDETKELHTRIKLDRRRFESAHLKYSMLMTKSEYQHLSSFPVFMTTDVSDSLKKFTPLFYDSFCEKYSGKLYILGMCSFQHKWASELHLYLFVLLHHVLSCSCGNLLDRMHAKKIW